MEEKDYYKLERAPYCSINELYGILKDKTLKLSKMTNPQIDQIFKKTLNYCERFNKVHFENVEKNSQRSQEIRRILEENELNLTNVEKSQLINLLPQKSEEAFALIPSLREKCNDEEFQHYLDLLQKYNKNI